MPEVFDLDAFIDEKQETQEPFRFTFGGHTFEIGSNIDLRALGAFKQGDLEEALRRMLGGDQYAILNSVDKPFGVEAFRALIDRYGEHLGIGDSGKSSESTNSSRPTSARSKPTSNGSTGST